MNASNFDISSLTGESPSGGGGSTTPPTNATFHGCTQMQPNAASNSLASSVNLASIQSLVDLLVELPLPTETPQQTSRGHILITPSQEQQHTVHNLNAELCQQHQLSMQLSSPLILAKRQLQEMNLQWINVPLNQGNEQYSEQHQMNSYLLSLLQQNNVFGEHVKCPPVNQYPASNLSQPHPVHTQPSVLPPPQAAGPAAPSAVPQGPQTRSHSHQYWNPFLSEPPSNAPSPATAPPPALNRYPNQTCNNDNSNSSSSFSETPATPGTPSYSFPQQTVPRNARYQLSENGVHVKHPQSVQPLEQLKPDVKMYQNSLDKEPMVVLDKLDVDAANLHLAFGDGSLQSYSSLGDRVKSHKRQRSNCTVTSTPKGDHNSRVVNTHHEKSSSKECKETTPQKKSTPKASSPVKSLSFTSIPQLSSQISSAPPLEKFEAMLDELFDLNKGKKILKESSSESDSDESEDGKPSKKRSSKTNGENCESKAVLFDITLTPTTLFHFVGLTAKLKRNNSMQNMSVSKLINLLTVLTQQLAIQSASLRDKRRKSVDGTAGEEDDDEDENITNSSALMAKFETCCDCCLVALYIMTSKGMSSRVFLEECIEQIIAFLNTTIQQYTTVGAAPSVACSSKKSKSPKKANNSLPTNCGVNKKTLLKMYMKWSELIGCIVELLTARSGTLTDTLVLSTTRVALGAFFLENLNASSSSLSTATQTNEIQLNALRLTTSIFSQYSNHRGMILEEILHSIARLPTSKRGRVVYKVDGEDGSTAAISMFSALLLQLIQSLFNECKKDEKSKKSNVDVNAKEKDSEKESKKNKSLLLRQQYDAALRTAYSFLSTFLRKCCGLAVGSMGGQADADFRVLFEGLVNDLMITLYKPNWPAAQLLTQVMIKLCVTNITTSSSKGNSAGKSAGGGGANAQLNLKLASLDHLGTICSRFAKELSDIDKVKEDVKTSLSNIVNGDLEVDADVEKCNKSDECDENDDKSDSKSKKSVAKNKSKIKSTPKKGKEKEDMFEDDEVLNKEIWKQLLRYCDEEKLVEEKNLFASIWLRESEREAEGVQTQTNERSETGEAPRSWQEVYDMKVKRFMSLYRNASNANYFDDEEYHVIDSRTAELIIRYIDITFTTTVKLFESALGHVIAALSTTSNTTMRSRAMKSLSTILNNAPKKYATTLLSRNDLQRATKAALLDPSTSVREATIDLIGKFILNGQSEDLIDKYYDIITERVLDTGVSVRKRVIKILREICLTYPSYKRVPEICSKIIKRINDDGEGIRKLVTETFTSMWFKQEKDKEASRIKVECITHVVATVLTDFIGTEWLQQLLTNLFNNSTTKKSVGGDDDEEDAKPASAQQVQQVTNASAQIVDVLIGDILCGDQQTIDQQQQPNNKSNCVAAMTTIWLFGKVCPQLLVNHISTLQPYLSLKCTTQLDIMIMIKVVQIIEHVLPKLANPSESLLARIEEDLTKNILQNNAQVLGVCVSCLSSLIHRHTNNRTLAQDLFKKFFAILDYLVRQPNLIQQPVNRPKLLRSLFTCGLFAKYFDFLEEKQRLFEIFVKFVSDNMPSEDNKVGDLDILLKALTGLGFMFERNPSYTLKQQTQDIYKPILNAAVINARVDDCLLQYQENAMCQVLKNLTNYLSDEFNNEMTSQIEWSKENLKTMTSDEGDTDSIQSSIIQLYLSDVVKCTLSPLLTVRRAAVNLIHIIHNGGIVHPLQLVPYLIAISSDDDYTIRSRADHVLNEIERKYHGFVSMKSKQGVQLSFQLHSHTGRRGYRVENVFQANNSQSPVHAFNQEQELLITGRLSTLYSVVAGNRQSRRAFVGGLLKYFDLGSGNYGFLGSTYDSMLCNTFMSYDENVEEAIQQFVCDNIIWLPYSVWDEPLYLLHQLDLTLSLIASQTQSHFKDVLNLEGDDDDEEEVKNTTAPKVDLNLDDQQTEIQPLTTESGESCTRIDASTETVSRKSTAYHIPSTESVMELLRYLKTFYMLSWCKQLIRELFAITDVKLQDYSPNENQKVWDKVVHRRNVDVRVLDKLMKYPTIEITLENGWDRNVILAEYQRFKNLQLTGVDNCSKSVIQLLKEPVGKPKPASVAEQQHQHQHQHQSLQAQAYQGYSEEEKCYPELSREEKEKLIERIKSNQIDCKISLVDISSTIKSPIKEPGLKLTINTSKRKKKKKEKHKKKKHKKHKFRLASSEEEEEESESDSSDDSDYC